MRVFETCEEGVWWDVARRSEHATFFHTPLWHRLAARTLLACRDASVTVELPSGVRAVFPLLRRRHGVRPGALAFASTFAGCYGGPIADGPLPAGDRVRLYREVAVRCGARIAVTGNPMDDGGVPGEFGRRCADETHLLTLDAPFETLFSAFSKGHRSSTTKGRREGIVTRIAQTVNDYRRYYNVYRAALRRWGGNASSRYPWRLFRIGQRLANGHPDRLRLWLAELEDEVVAGAWVFYWNGHAVYWHGASTDRGRGASATNVLVADVIRDACERGMRYFDFNPSGGHEGVAAFKRRFGAEPTPLERWTAEPGGGGEA